MIDNKDFDLDTWEATMPAAYDLRQAYQQSIKPLMQQLHDACKEAGMPMLICVATSQDSVGTGMDALQYFPGAERTPASMLMALHALKVEWPQMVMVDEAAERRGVMIEQAQAAAGVMLASVTKH